MFDDRTVSQGDVDWWICQCDLGGGIIPLMLLLFRPLHDRREDVMDAVGRAAPGTVFLLPIPRHELNRGSEAAGPKSCDNPAPSLMPCGVGLVGSTTSCFGWARPKQNDSYRQTPGSAVHAGLIAARPSTLRMLNLSS
jgi:hypothetical protein